jgi:hypothetical protein
VGLGVAILPRYVGLVASCWPAATVENIPTIFCRLGCRVRLCVVSVGVFFALYVCLLLEVWVTTVSYKRNYILLGKGKIFNDCF